MNDIYISIILGVLYFTPIIFIIVWIKKQRKQNTHIIQQLNDYTTKNLTYKLNGLNREVQQLNENNITEFNKLNNRLSSRNKEVDNSFVSLLNEQVKSMESIVAFFNNTNRLTEKNREELKWGIQSVTTEVKQNTKQIDKRIDLLQSSQKSINNNISSLNSVVQEIIETKINEIKDIQKSSNEKNISHQKQTKKDLENIIYQLSEITTNENKKLRSHISESNMELFNTLKTTLTKSTDAYNKLHLKIKDLDSYIELSTNDFPNKLSTLEDLQNKNHEMMNTIYNDFDMLVELLKAGLMNDLVKDLKELSNNVKI